MKDLEAYLRLYEQGLVNADSAFEMHQERGKLPRRISELTAGWQGKAKAVLIGVPVVAGLAAISLAGLGYGEDTEIVNPDGDPGKNWELGAGQ